MTTPPSEADLFILGTPPEKTPTELKWHPIETAPGVWNSDIKFAVIAKSIREFPFTTHPYYVCRNRYGEFVGWPHTFPPTHWHPMPEFD
jgi:hypothetical protein